MACLSSSYACELQWAPKTQHFNQRRVGKFPRALTNYLRWLKYRRNRRVRCAEASGHALHVNHSTLQMSTPLHHTSHVWRFPVSSSSDPTACCPYRVLRVVATKHAQLCELSRSSRMSGTRGLVESKRDNCALVPEPQQGSNVFGDWGTEHATRFSYC